MTDMQVVINASIFYYNREMYYHKMQLSAIEGLKINDEDPVYRFYYGISLILESRISEAIRELSTVGASSDVRLGAVLASLYAYKKESMLNQDMIMELSLKLEELNIDPSEMELYYAGAFYFLLSDLKKAYSYMDQLLKKYPKNREASVLKGWILLLTSEERISKDILHCFDSSDNSDPEALFGRAKYHEKLGNYAQALEILNQAVVLFPHYLPSLIEKMKILLTLLEWDQTKDTYIRILNDDRNNIEALRYVVVYDLCKNGHFDESQSSIGEVMQALRNLEPRSAFLYYETAQLFSRLCSRNEAVLKYTYNMINEANVLDPLNIDYKNELGYQCLLQGKLKDAMQHYRNASKLDETNIQSFIGTIHCQILSDQLDAADQQLELFREVNLKSETASENYYLCALLAHKQSKSPKLVTGYLNDCIAAHLILEGQNSVRPYSSKYYRLLNPDFVLLVIKLYVNYIPNQQIAQGQHIPVGITKCTHLLKALIKACPGILEVPYFMARFKYLSSDLDEAKNMLEYCLEHDEAYADARLLMARIFYDEGNYHLANQALEIALSYSFTVREKPLYHLIKARVLKKQNNIEEAIKTLQSGMSLAGLKSAAFKNLSWCTENRAKSKKEEDLSIGDKVSLCLELVDCHRSLGEQQEAVKVMQEASLLFKGTPEAGRFTIGFADLELAKGKIDEAINILKEVGPEQPYFVQAWEKMAHIYLQYRKDRKLYAGCYREIMEQYPNTQTYLLLGDAYMNIQEPEKAIEVFEYAIKRNPRDSVLARKIGEALVKTHHYEKAVTYYKAAIKSGGAAPLKYDMADLLFQMKRYKEAEDVVTAALESDKHAGDFSWLQWESKLRLLLSKVYLKQQNEDKAFNALQRAWEVQTRVMRRVHIEDPDSLPEQRQITVNICRQLAEHASGKNDYSPAIQFYKEALVFDDDNPEILLALAKLEMAANNLDSARQYCQSVLKNYLDNDEATLMMADLMFRKTDLDAAVFHFQQLLARKPDYFGALARYVEAMRRLGKLDEVPSYLQKAEECGSRSSLEAGFNYCKGLYEWYTGNTSGAMKCFNQARHDAEWGQIATYHMIEICVNPDNESLAGEVFEGDSDAVINERAHFQESAIKTAEKLLNELKSKVGADLDIRIMNNFIVLAKNVKADAEDALNDFLQIVSDERHKDHVGAILGMATAYVILKQTPRARNQLKRIAKNPWNFAEAEYLERAWLLLADISIKSGKLDAATELLKRVLQHNKSCTKAYDYLGHIMEKEQTYKDACNYYERAWKLTNKSNPVIGYKLAFNYMKAKRYVDAIDVCHIVLKKHPNYPKIQKEILDKSRSNLRS